MRWLLCNQPPLQPTATHFSLPTRSPTNIPAPKASNRAKREQGTLMAHALVVVQPTPSATHRNPLFPPNSVSHEHPSPESIESRQARAGHLDGPCAGCCATNPLCNPPQPTFPSQLGLPRTSQSRKHRIAPSESRAP